MIKSHLLVGGSCLAAAVLSAVGAWAQSETKTYQYDQLGRLVSTQVNGGLGNSDTRTVCYDAMGNRVNFKTRNDGSMPGCTAPSPAPSPTPTPPSPTPTPTPTPTPSNNPPIANEDSVGGGCGTTTYYDLLLNDTDPEGNYPLVLLSITRTSGQSSATLFSTTIVKIDHYGFGQDFSTFNYVVRDSLGATSTGQLTVSTSPCETLPP
jgi:hypothetical protein